MQVRLQWKNCAILVATVVVLLCSAGVATATPQLDVATAGSGAGTVWSSLSGINGCPACSASFPDNSVIVLRAVPDAGSWFTGWAAACTGQALSCSVTMDAAKTVTANFTNVPPFVGTWANTYSTSYSTSSWDIAQAIQQTSDGGYIVGGVSYSNYAYHALILKLDGGSNVQWQKIYDSVRGDNIVRSIQQTADGGYVFASEGGLLVKIDAGGNVQWQKSYDDDFHFYSIQQTSDGGYIIAGEKYWGTVEPYHDFLVMKVDGSGNIQWQNSYGGLNTEVAYSVKQTTDGAYIVAGYTLSYGTGNPEVWILKLTSTGTVEWQNTYGGANNDFADSIQQTRDGGYIIAGSTKSFGAGGSDAWIVKLDSGGIIQWQKAYGGTGDDSARSIVQTSDGGYTVVGSYSSASGETGAWFFKIDSSGSIAWQKTYKEAEAWSIQETGDGGYIAVGYLPGLMDVLVVKLDGNGNFFGCSPGMRGTTSAVVTNTSAAVTPTAATITSTAAIVTDGTPAVVDPIATATNFCNGQEPPAVSPSPFAFSSIPPGSTSSQTFTISNIAPGILSLGQFAITGSQYSLTDDNCSNTVLLDSGSCAITVSYTPQQAGFSSANIEMPYTRIQSFLSSFGLSGGSGIMTDTLDNGLPAGWSVVDNTGNGGWVFWPPILDSSVSGNLTGGTGGFAIADSNYFGDGDIDTELISSPYDLSALSHAWLQFKSDFYYNGTYGEIADVDVSPDGGTTWINVWRWTGGDHRGPRTEQVDISAIAAGKPNVKVRFHYYNANYDWWWQVDDVVITSEAMGTWIVSIVDPQAQVNTWYPSVAVDGSNAVHVAYLDDNVGGIQYAINASGSWAASTAYNGDGVVVESMQLAVDVAGRAHICFSDYNYQLWHLTNSGGSWAATLVDSTGGYACGIAADSAGHAHIAYGDATLRYATNTTGTWTTSPVPGAGMPYGSSIKVDNQNFIHIAYVDQPGYPNPSHVKYADNISGSWALTDLDTLGCTYGCTEAALALDQTGKTHITWENSGLRHASNASGAWQVETAVPSALPSGFPRPGNALALDTNGNAYTSYEQYDDGTFMYANNVGGSWATTQITSVGQSIYDAAFNNIAYGSGRPHVVFGDRYNGGLFYATTVTAPPTDTTPPTDGTLTATPGNNQASLSWTPATDSGSGVDHYLFAWGINGFGMLGDCSTGTNVGNITSYAHSGLTNGQTYYYRVCAVDGAGNISAGATAQVLPSVDITPPMIIAIAPASGATGVATTGIFTATFSEPMDSLTTDPTTVTIVRKSDSAPITLNVSYDVANKVVMFSPTSPLDYNTTYTATIKGPGGVKDVTGNAMAADYSWEFTTETLCVSAPSGLVSWWKGEGNANDQTGANNGTLMNGATFAPRGSGQAFSFNGSGNQYVSLPNITMSGMNSFSVGAWFRTTSAGVIFGAQESAYGASGPFPSEPLLHVRNDGRLSSGIWNAHVLSSQTVTDGNWHYASVSYDGSAAVAYLDGTSIGSASGLTSLFQNPAYVQIGTGYTVYWDSAANGWFDFNGQIDEVQLYNRALTAAEIQTAYNAGSNGVCTSSPATVTLGNTVQTYDGTPKAPTAVTTPPGLPVTYSYLDSGSNPVVSPTKAGSYTVTATIAHPIYQGSTSGAMAISPRTLNVTASGINKVYDGTLAANITFGDDRIAGDSFAVGGSATFADKNVGGNKPVSVTGITITGADSVNYSLAATSATTTANISAAPLTITTPAVTGKTYDRTNAAVITGTLTGTVSPDVVTLSGTGTFASSAVGTGIAVTSTSILSGADAGNYTLTQPTGLTGNITPRTLLVTATGTSKIYDGSTSATITYGDDRLAGDLFTVTGTAAYADKNVGISKPVNVTGIAISGVAATNYSLATTSAGTAADITPRALTVSASCPDKTYDGNLTATVSLSDNRVAGDNLTASYSAAAFVDKNSGASKPVNVTGIAVIGTDVANYTLTATSVTATANINAATLSVTGLSASSKVYDGLTGATLSGGSLAGVLGTDQVSISGSYGTFSDKNAGSGKPVIVSSIMLAGADAGNYTVTSPAGITADITPAPLVITANSLSKIYGQTYSFSGAEFTATGLQNGETIGSVTMACPGDDPAATISGGPYPITASSATGGTFIPANYAITYKAGLLTVTQSTVTITATATAGGTITPAGTTTVSLGANQAYTISPSAGYYLTDLKVDGISQGAQPSYTFSSVAASHTIEAQFFKPDGVLDPANTTGVPKINDALIVLSFALGETTPTPDQLHRCDAAPMVNGIPHPDGKIDLADVLIVLRRVVGFTN